MDLAQTAALIGDETRACMLLALLDGRPRSAGDLARQAGVSPATGSQHLARLLDAGLLAVAPDGRHRFYSLAGHHVAEALETLARISPHSPVRSLRQASTGESLRYARSCYDHLAGGLGVLVAEALIRKDVIAPLSPGRPGALLDPEHPLLADLGLTLPVATPPTRRPLVRGCLDWSERRPHVAGYLGASILESLATHAWVKRRRNDRGLTITPAGAEHFAAVLDLDIKVMASS